LFQTESEIAPSSVIVDYHAIVSAWTSQNSQPFDNLTGSKAPAYVPA